MINLGLENVCLKARPGNKREAIQQAGKLLVDSGFVEPGYVDSMLRREEQANTYLGNGIAIPHGQPQDRDWIRKTGISVTQIPDGVEWNPGERVHLVVGIAARSDEHLQILTNLTHVLDDPAAVQRLVHTNDPSEIIERLTRSTTETAGSSNGHQQDVEFEQGVDLVIRGKSGLHARPATAFVERAKAFDADIQVRCGDRTANGKSLMSLLKLGVESGSTIRLMARGRDAAAALKALQVAVEEGLEETDEEPTTPVIELPALNLSSPSINGVSASPGIAIAPLHRYERSRLIFSETAESPEAELRKLLAAIATAKAELSDLYDTVKQRAGAGKAAIFQAHQEFLDDPELLQATTARLASGQTAASVWQQETEARAKTLEGLSDRLLAERATDVRDVGQRVLRHLAERVDETVQLPDTPVILVANDLTPSDTASFDPARIQGFCTARGGATSHAAIMARSLNIPAVVGAGETVLSLPVGGVAVLDGDRGVLYAQPSEADLVVAAQAQQEHLALRDVEWQSRFQPALTPDGHRVEVVANIGAPEEAEQAILAGGEGVGLLRTEFLFLNRTEPPTQAEQSAAYQRMAQSLNGLPLIVRTLDIGGDKEIPYLNLPAEENPFLGVRGIRLCLTQRELFETQLRAILQAASSGYLRIMFPMVATLEELRAAKAILESVRRSLNAPPLEVGMMVEVPSVVLMAREFAREVDFFSVGTNDLTQYLLAMDRGHPALAKQADGLHPAVLRAIAQTVEAAESEGKWVGVCGGIAGDPLGAAILTGLGVSELSMSIASIPAVKARIRSLPLTRMQKLAQRSLRCQTAEEVRSL
ncbi:MULTISPECIES: phosphoenolpyruvate--protein phosphotransferase [unclassified Leptolyngbya]|uniref:phosphoenolpyruvate--protein phosphotransferase n=1 Tax=unclassified Leptolyngbya TaxID=2650499 RepID=UPI001689A4C8|nr:MULTISPECIES: phosphoenolpyruvate--protein phosphotransferase [unclassified Leptolyngbya]MBD1909789.1 phosphoenolpyruvate--protein phosphotransferase [Leptolyngbya sp. FACHB-8]MBD2158940.1 phosphoenolpyruvate--protein phosphotransferase [Leptolyngbya sp. FACHB-16]